MSESVAVDVQNEDDTALARVNLGLLGQPHTGEAIQAVTGLSEEQIDRIARPSFPRFSCRSGHCTGRAVP